MRGAFAVVAVLGVLGACALGSTPALAVITTPQSPITIGANPVGATVSADGTKVYVAISGGSKLEVLTRATNVLSEVDFDPTECTGPMGVAFSGTKGYVPCLGTGNVIEFEDGVATQKVIPVGVAPFFIAMSPDGTKAYVANSGTANGTVSVIDTTTDTVTATIPVGPTPVAIAFNAAGTKAYVASASTAAGGNGVTMINVSTSTVPVGTVAQPNPIPIGGIPYGLAVSPLDGSLWVSRDNGLKASVVNTTTNTVTNMFTLTGKPEGVTFSPDGTRVFMPMQTGGVAVFNAVSKTQLPYITTNIGTSSRIMAFTPDGTVGYVTNNTEGTLSVIDFDWLLPTITGTPAAGSETYPYSFTPSVTGTNVTVTVQSGMLPPGLSLNSSTGAVTGTPTSVVTSAVTLRATDANGFADLPISFAIGAAPSPTIMATTPLAVAVGSALTYTPTITALAGYTVTSTPLPSWVTLNPATGNLSGVATGAPTTTPVTLTVTDGNGMGTANIDITVQHAAATSLTLTPSNSTPTEGDTITLAVLAHDAFGNVWDVSSTAVITSSVSSDIIVGNQITFTHASPHTLSATLGSLQSSVLLQVTPRTLVLPTTGGTIPLPPILFAALSISGGLGIMVARKRRRSINRPRVRRS
jgi:YVTN family beta-propeller protein